MLAGASGFLYSVSFVVVARLAPEAGALLTALFLLLGGLLATAALVALHGRVRDAEPGFALWALGLGVFAAIGSALHGGYDLANVINPPAAPSTAGAQSNLPSQIDPRGLLTFGVAGVALFAFAWLIRRGAALPRGLGALGYVSAALLVVIYLGRLIVLDPASPLILGPAGLEGFLVNPIWYVWLGLALRRT